MADKFRLYVLCPSCGGTGVLHWGTQPGSPGETECPTCKDDPEQPFRIAIFDGLRHIYAGRFEEVEDEE
jgi:hypothetical protein